MSEKLLKYIWLDSDALLAPYAYDWLNWIRLCYVSGVTRRSWNAPGGTIQGGDTLISLIFLDWIYKEYWRKDYLEGGEGGSDNDE